MGSSPGWQLILMFGDSSELSEYLPTQDMWPRLPPKMEAELERWLRG